MTERPAERSMVKVMKIELRVVFLVATVALFTLPNQANAAEPSPPRSGVVTVTRDPNPVPTELPQNWYEEMSRPKAGYVPNAETAIAIAKAVWVPIYGKSVLKQEPVRASLVGDEWIVSGTFQGTGFGGVATARISKSSGCIVEVIHGE